MPCTRPRARARPRKSERGRTRGGTEGASPGRGGRGLLPLVPLSVSVSVSVWIRPPLLSLLRSRRCRRLRRGSPRGRPWGPFGGGEAEEERRWRFWTFEKEAGGGEELARYMTKTKTTGRRRGSGRASGAPRSLRCARKRTSLSSWCALSEREGVERERESERARERDERASEFSRSYLLKKAKKKFSFDARGNEQTITNQRFRRSNARTRSLCLSVSSLSLFLV